jgi:hypothetical protein
MNELGIDYKKLERGIHAALDERKRVITERVRASALPARVVPKVTITTKHGNLQAVYDHSKLEWVESTLIRVAWCHHDGTANKTVLEEECKACPHRKGRYCTSSAHIENVAIRKALSHEK